MTIQECNVTCQNVTQEQCQTRREQQQCVIDGQDKRVQSMEIQCAYNKGIMEVQTRILWGILGTGILGFLYNVFSPFMKGAL